jgi:hypothetical protein
MNQLTGKYLIIAGIIIALAGIIIFLFGNRLNFLGRLPGDIRIERNGSGFYFPITTCILISVILTVIFKVVTWLMR